MKIVRSSTKSFNNAIVFIDIKKKILLPDQLKDNEKLKSYLNLLSASLKLLKETNIIESYFQNGNSTSKIILVVVDNIANSALKIGGSLGKNLLNQKIKEVSIFYPTSKEYNEHSHDFFQGFLLGLYRFEKYKTIKDNDKILEKIIISSGIDKKEFDRTIQVNYSVKLARDMANTGGNDFNPIDFKINSEKLAKRHKLKFSCFNENQIKKMGMGCFYSVTQGSSQSAYLCILEHKSEKSKDTIMLVGKGLTFDSGGISLKPAQSMEEMKFDKCGGTAVIGVMDLVGKFKPDVNVVALIPTTENMINGQASKPGDIVTAYNNMTVEITNTDAEGRLILCDSISYGIEKYKPSVVIDVATLTGSVMVALGRQYSGLFCNNEKIAKRIEKSAINTGELIWRLPLDDAYMEDMKSDYADIRNSGSRWAGACTAAIFLKAFIKKNTPWIHLDIAGTAMDVKNVDHYPTKGATGVGVRLLYDFIDNW